MARFKIINPLLLYEVELDEIMNLFESSNMPPLSTEEMLKISDVSILQYKMTPLNIIKTPEYTFENNC